MLRIAAATGFLAVALGAFGAHGLQGRLLELGTSEVWKTASFYHLCHAVVLLILALALPQARWVFRLMTLGLLIFSGSLYVLSLSGIKVLGAITPIGGVLLLVAWALLFFSQLRQ
ncbi:MAG: DUF423 domain-containing protein [Blastochloris sp.]|nr:DUF423 domain-containing protein [Blastochloris sp.]